MSLPYMELTHNDKKGVSLCPGPDTKKELMAITRNTLVFTRMAASILKTALAPICSQPHLGAPTAHSSGCIHKAYMPIA